jgi:spore coat polysaccharide biosynthesis predicted glycosyltransferase SpsG
VFDEPTKLFSQAQVPLIADVLPMLDSIEKSMTLVVDDNESELPDVVRVAARAVLLLIDKYYSLMKECELYVIAIGECNTLYLCIPLLTLSLSSYVPR